MTDDQRVGVYCVVVVAGIVGVTIWSLLGEAVWPLGLLVLPAFAGWRWVERSRPSWDWLDNATWWGRLLVAVPVGLFVAFALVALGERNVVGAALFAAEMVIVLCIAAWTADDRAAWVPGGLVLGLLCVTGLLVGWSSNNMIDRYCQYGAVSEAQYQGCVDHVSADDIRARDTPAARFAKGN